MGGCLVAKCFKLRNRPLPPVIPHEGLSSLTLHPLLSQGEVLHAK